MNELIGYLFPEKEYRAIPLIKKATKKTSIQLKAETFLKTYSELYEYKLGIRCDEYEEVIEAPPTDLLIIDEHRIQWYPYLIELVRGLHIRSVISLNNEREFISENPCHTFGISGSSIRLRYEIIGVD